VLSSQLSLSSGANLYQNLQFFANFEALGPHFLSKNDEIWHEGADLGLPPPSQILEKSLKEYTPFRQIYTKNYQFRQF